ncbi:AGAP007908-PA, partial [Anopheles gambiae str. PEST]
VGLVEMGSRTHTKKKREPHSPPGPEHDRCSKSKTNTHTTKQKQKTYTQGGDRKQDDDGAQNSPKPAARDQRGKRRCGARMLQDKRSTSGSWRFADECRLRDGTDRHRNRSVQLTSRECSIISKIIKRKCTYNVAEAHGPKRPAKVGRRKGNRTRSKGRRCRAMQCRVCSSLQGEGKNVASKFARNRELRTAKNRTGNKRIKSWKNDSNTRLNSSGAGKYQSISKNREQQRSAGSLLTSALGSISVDRPKYARARREREKKRRE